MTGERMKVNDELYVLEILMDPDGPIMNLSLIRDLDHGLTLVDTALPGQIDLIEIALKQEGFSPEEIKKIVITHQDMDHVGCLHALKERTRATVYAYVDEVLYIDGTLTPIKFPTAERLAQNPNMAEKMKHYKPLPVDEAVQDGHVLEKSAGAVVVATPGHTPGHMSLYLPRTKTLIAGDALTSDSGALNGPLERATPDMGLAMESVRKLAELDVESIVCYHGGLVVDDALGQLKRVAG
jgi:glyoxylase-like metal-dependent hydrolase (beta-lactamase superfamily II)